VVDVAVFDNEVRLFVYRFFVEAGRPPVPAEVAAGLASTPPEVEASFRRLAEGHVLVLAPGTPYIWMANPLSALPTPFRFETGDRIWFGNCIWDALGISAMLRADGSVSSWCADCGDPLAIGIEDANLRAAEGLVHFAVPAARWWDDIGFT
jgi:hypothetical protein